MFRSAVAEVAFTILGIVFIYYCFVVAVVVGVINLLSFVVIIN